MQAAATPTGPEQALASQRRMFRWARLALGAIAFAFAVMAGIQTHRSFWMQHGREVGRLAREIRVLTVARYSPPRAQPRPGHVDAIARSAESERALAAMSDSLVRLTIDNARQHARALAIRDAIKAWERGSASRGDASASQQVFLDSASSRLREFLGAEETLYRRRVTQERFAFRTTVAIMLLGMLALMFGLRGLRQRLSNQTKHIVTLADTATRQNVELTSQAEQLSLQNEEFRQLTEQLQEQAVELEDQAATLEEHEAELEATLDELRENEERFRTLVNSMTDMVYTVDRDQRCLELYGRWTDFERVDRASVIGRTPDEIFNSDAAGVHREAHHQALRGVPTVYEWTMGDGTVARHFTTAVSPLRDAHGQVVGAVGVTRDVSEQRQREERHRATEDQLRHTQRLDAIGQLAGGVAHDFNNLLTVVISYCEMLTMDLGPESPSGPMLAQIRHAALRGAKLTAQLLAVSRQQVMRIELIDLNIIVRRTEEMLRRVIDTSIALQLQLAPRRAFVKADAAQIEQILMNLVINSRDAMPVGGTITIVIRNTVVARDDAAPGGVPEGDYIELAVIDTGSGMSRDVRDRIFEPFFTTKPVGSGTGLGLATVHGIVTQSDGHIEVDSEPGRGTTFRVLLPRAEATTEQIAQIRDAEPVPQLEPTDWSPRAVTPAASVATVTGTVLLVDDDHAVRQVAEQLLIREGHTVIAVDSAIDALHLLEKGQQGIDLILSDVVMPHMSGRELAYEVRIRYPQAAIILMSGYSKERALKNDALGSDTIFLDKPFTREAFLSAVRIGLAAVRKRAAIPSSGSGRIGRPDERPVSVIVNSVDAIVWEADAKSGVFHYVNRRAETLLGYPLTQWLEAGFFESIIHDDDRPGVLAQRAQAIRTGVGYDTEYRVRNDAGAHTWLRDQIQPVLGESGHVTHLRGVMLDVTEKKLADEELARSVHALDRERAFLSALLDNMSDGIVACDDSAVLTLFNHASRELHGLPVEAIGPDEWAGRYGLYHPDGVTPMRPEEIPLYRALSGETVNNAEIVVVPPSGQPRSLLASGRRFDDEEGAVRGAVIAMRDVTEIKAAERELVRARDVAERANQAKSQFLSLISHELRTPLTAVIGFAAVLQKNRRGALDAGDLAYLHRISTNGQALLRLVDDLLDLTDMEAGASEAVLSLVSLQQAIPEALAEFEDRARAASLTLRADVDQGLLPVRADPVRLRSLIGKLVDNALKFTRAGGIEVRVVADDGRIASRIEVTDTGIGVEPNLLDAVFALFQQGGQFTVRRHGGSGLGLHLARRYCELMGFSLTLRSTPGVGSTFSIELSPPA